MPDGIAALRAAGLEQEAKELEQHRAQQAESAPAEAAAPQIGADAAAAGIPAEVVEQAQAASGPTPPPGKAPLRTMADIEALPAAEFNARYAEVHQLL